MGVIRQSAYRNTGPGEGRLYRYGGWAAMLDALILLLALIGALVLGLYYLWWLGFFDSWRTWRRLRRERRGAE